MKTKILIKIDEIEDYLIGSTLWSENSFIENQSYRKKNKHDLINLTKDELLKIMTEFGTDYITHHSNDDNFVRCPDAKVVLPIDSFYCKHDNEPCFLGGGVFKKNEQNFLDNCRIEEKKEGIWNAIKTKRYKGFHHVPGRYLCPSCEEKNSETRNYEKRINFNYHYPWELCKIGQFLDNKDLELTKDLIRLGISRNVYYASFCASCSVELLDKIGIHAVFEIIETDVSR
jgi:hypothetical protein